MNDTCRLCGKSADLRNSYLIPNFVLKRFYRTSPTGGARTVGEPNRRVQGTYDERPLLCSDCEVSFGRRETIWAPMDRRLSGTLPWALECLEEHRYFAASIVWRTLKWRCDAADPGWHSFTDDDKEAIRNAEESLRAYLLGERAWADDCPWLHLIVPPHGFTDGPKNVNTYLRAGLDTTVNGHDDGLYCVVVLAGYLVAAVLRVNGDHLITWTLGTELRPGNTVHANPYAFPQDPNFREVLAWRAAEIKRGILSSTQQQNVNRRLEAAIDPAKAASALATLIATLPRSFSECAKRCLRATTLIVRISVGGCCAGSITTGTSVPKRRSCPRKAASANGSGKLLREVSSVHDVRGAPTTTECAAASRAIGTSRVRIRSVRGFANLMAVNATAQRHYPRRSAPTPISAAIAARRLLGESHS